MQLKSAVSLVTLGSLLVGTAPGASARQDQQFRPPARTTGYCQSAPALPRLAPEPQWQPDLQRRDRRHAAGRVVGDMAMAMPSAVPAPSPPPPAPAAEASGEIAVSAARAGRGEEAERGAPASDARIMPPYRPQPYPQAGLLTAGEHDDLLNPELYARYVKASDLGQAVRDLPRVDTRAVLTVEVRDDAGRPVPFAEVVVTCSDGNSLRVATLADGRAVFFPGVDRLSDTVRIALRRGGHRFGEERRVSVARNGGGQLVTLQADRGANPVRKLDLMLVVDTTGSMGDEIRFLQAELRAVVDALVRRHPQLDARIGFVFYRDEGDDYVTHTVAFDSRLGTIQTALARQQANGGGDYPEAMDQALIRAVGQGWRPDAVKSLLLVADAPPHDDKMGLAWHAARVAREKRIQITPVAASGVADTAEYAMRAMAALTQSRYLFLTDDSGIGNPHAPPAIDCYLVTRLDAALRRVLDSQISGRRVEPERSEVIRSVGQYDAGRCILPPDFTSS